MKRTLITSLTFLGIAAITLSVLQLAFAQEQSRGSLLHDAATGKIRPATIPVQIETSASQAAAPRAATTATTKTIEKRMPFFSPGLLTAAGREIEIEEESSELGGVSPGMSPGTVGCGQRNPDGNVRVNQDCSFRFQAEEGITFNPADRTNLLAGQNDGRSGFNQCGIAWSTDNGEHWGDLLPPFRTKINNPAAEQNPVPGDMNRHTIIGGPGTFHTYDAASDPMVAFDSRGNGFFGCVIFDVFTDASAVFVTQSPAGAQGSYFFNIAGFGRRFIVVEDNSALASHDKPFLVTDRFVNSPNRDNAYATWTAFKFSPNCGPQPNPQGLLRYCSSPIFGSMSTDHGQHWSTPEEISGTSSVLCFFGNFFDPTRNPHACDFDQGSDPTVLPNGEVEVIFNSGNTAANNPNSQQLGVHCHPTGSSPAGTAHMNCAAPAKVGDDVTVGEPLCDFGRGPEQCIPGAFIRTNDFPRINKTVTSGNLYAAWQDYRNGEFDIQISVSTNGGLTWSESGTVNPDHGLDHYEAAVELAPQRGNGDDDNDDSPRTPGRDRVGVSYYRTERVPNENTTPMGGFAPGQPGVEQGNSDYVLAGGTNLMVPYNFKVVSPVFPPPDGIQEGFNGDYSGLTINKGEEAHPIWSDTRNADPSTPANGVVNDEDIFTDKVGLPNGVGRPGVGHIGRSNSGMDNDR